jgi:hypothetical protein
MCGVCHLAQVKGKLLTVLETVMCFRPPENPGNFLRATSNNKVSG